MGDKQFASCMYAPMGCLSDVQLPCFGEPAPTCVDLDPCSWLKGVKPNVTFCCYSLLGSTFMAGCVLLIFSP